ncbi:uncharacterized protein [Watersipora subatra]|uniref:uncharacterized protein n=1 Tax=Watersipora subatra TaxID=2589382 RepID=UPI00355C0BCF
MCSSAGFLVLLGLLSYNNGLPLPESVGVKSGNMVEISSDVGVLREIFNDTVEVFDEETVLLYKPEAVYQINVPQTAVEASGILLSTEAPLSFLKSLESLGSLTLAEFSQLSGVAGNDQLVFDDWDVNGDGLLDTAEILQEETKGDTANFN